MHSVAIEVVRNIWRRGMFVALLQVRHVQSATALDNDCSTYSWAIVKT